MSQDRSPAAFPSDTATWGPMEGMSLRDYFAAKAIPVAFDNQVLGGLSKEHESEVALRICANAAYTMADAMLAAREVGNE